MDPEMSMTGRTAMDALLACQSTLGAVRLMTAWTSFSWSKRTFSNVQRTVVCMRDALLELRSDGVGSAEAGRTSQRAHVLLSGSIPKPEGADELLSCFLPQSRG